MPDPSNYSTEDEWMEACVSTMHDEGKPHDQAVAACMQMWRDKATAVSARKPVATGEARNVRSVKVDPNDLVYQKHDVPISDRAWSVLEIKSVDSEQRMIEGIASTPTVDRVGDIVEPMGAEFKLPLPLLHQHKHDQPVGQVVSARATKDGISIKAKFARVAEAGTLKDRIDTAWQEVKAGLVRGLSIGFKPHEFEPLDAKDPFGGLRFTRYSLYELSLVTIPANADANITLIKSLDQGIQAASGIEDTAVTSGGSGRGSDAAFRPGASGKSSVNLKIPEIRKMSKTISEHVSALEARRAANEARMADIMAKAMDEGRSTDDAERQEFDNLRSETEQVDADLKRFKDLERINLEKAKPVAEIKTVEDGSAARAGYVRVKAPELPPGIAFARMARCLGLAQGNRHVAAEIAERQYSDNPSVVGALKAAAYYGEVSDLAIKAAVNAATTTENQWAGSLVSAVAGEAGAVSDFLEFLRPQTILGKFGTNGIPALRRVPFRTGLISQTSGGAGYWVGEAAAKPLTRFDLNRQTLLPTKVANIAVCTEELLRDSSPSADEMIRNTLAAALRERLDIDFIDPTSTASGAKPASITSSATQVMSAGAGGAGTGTAAQVRNDVRAMIGAFIAANNDLASGVWIMRATTAMNLSMMVNALGEQEDFARNLTVAGGTFMGMPVIVSQYVPAVGSPTGDFVVLLDANSVWFADDGGLSVDMSREASLQMDDAPTMTGGGPDASPAAPTATSVVSLWQANLVGFRAERAINWKLARSNGVAVLTGGNWGE